MMGNVPTRKHSGEELLGTSPGDPGTLGCRRHARSGWAAVFQNRLKHNQFPSLSQGKPGPADFGAEVLVFGAGASRVPHCSSRPPSFPCSAQSNPSSPCASSPASCRAGRATCTRAHAGKVVMVIPRACAAWGTGTPAAPLLDRA